MENSKIEELVKEFLEKVQDILYKDDKYTDKSIAEIILKILENKYDNK
jgi:hypothetical protein